MSKTRVSRSGGFTLAEVLVSMTLIAMLGSLMAALLLGTTRTYLRAEKKVAVQSDFNRVGQVFTEQGNRSNGFFLYRTFATGHRNASSKQLGAGESGDFVVFIHYCLSDVRSSPNSQRVARVVGLFREDQGNGFSDIRWFDSDKQNWGQTFGPASPADISSPNSVESLLPSASYLRQCPVLISHSYDAAVAAGSDASVRGLFYNDHRMVRMSGFLSADPKNPSPTLQVRANLLTLTATPRT